MHAMCAGKVYITTEKIKPDLSDPDMVEFYADKMDILPDKLTLNVVPEELQSKFRLVETIWLFMLFWFVSLILVSSYLTITTFRFKIKKVCCCRVLVVYIVRFSGREYRDLHFAQVLLIIWYEHMISFWNGVYFVSHLHTDMNDLWNIYEVPIKWTQFLLMVNWFDQLHDQYFYCFLYCFCFKPGQLIYYIFF